MGRDGTFTSPVSHTIDGISLNSTQEYIIERSESEHDDKAWANTIFLMLEFSHSKGICHLEMSGLKLYGSLRQARSGIKRKKSSE